MKRICKIIASFLLISAISISSALASSKEYSKHMNIKQVEMNESFKMAKFANVKDSNTKFYYDLTKEDDNVKLKGYFDNGTEKLEIVVEGSVSEMQLKENKILLLGDLGGTASNGNKLYKATVAFNEYDEKHFFTLSLYDEATNESIFFDIGKTFQDKLERLDKDIVLTPQDDSKVKNLESASVSMLASSSSFAPFELAKSAQSAYQDLHMYRYPSGGAPQIIQVITTKSDMVKYNYNYSSYGKMDIIPVKTKLHTENVKNNGLYEINFIDIAPDKIVEEPVSVVINELSKFISGIPIAGQIYDAIVEYADNFKSSISVEKNITGDKSFDWTYDLIDTWYTYQAGNIYKNLEDFPVNTTFTIQEAVKNTIKSTLTIDYIVLCYPKTGNIFTPINRYTYTTSVNGMFNYYK